MKEKVRSVFGCLTPIAIILAVAFVIITQLDFFKSRFPGVSVWAAFIGALCVPSFFVITGILTDDRAKVSRKVRNIFIYFAILGVFVAAIFLVPKFFPKVSKEIDSFIMESELDFTTMSTPNSTAFEHVGYEKTEHILAVEFRDSGYQYFYYNVPRSVWEEFINSESLGSYYNENIKDNYDFKLIN